MKSEFELIDWIKSQTALSADGLLTGIGDDMAVLQLAGEKILITTDTLLDGVHFNLEKKGSDAKSPPASLRQVGYKAMACSLSDCAAMAAVPWIAVVAATLPNHFTMTDAQQLYLGLQQAATKYHCPIVGGDTTSWDKPLAITVTMLARADGIEPVLRSGAQSDDVIMVTGVLGGSLAGRHLTFEPRLVEARLLARLTNLHALIDLSDGLSSDLNHICQQSNVAAIIESQKIPISPAAQTSPDPLNAALNDGEDFELLFCLAPSDADRLIQIWSDHSPIPITPMGRITQSQPVQSHNLFIQYPNQTVRPLPPKGYEHFR